MEKPSSFELLWTEYAHVFRELDDLTLARWMCQTLGQLEGRAWRLSHPLVGSYRLGAKICQERQVWFKRLATSPAGYSEAPCCRAPVLPLITRDAKEVGLYCIHCAEVLAPYGEIPAPVARTLGTWADAYETNHAVAHWDDRQRKQCGDYDAAFENAAEEAERLLSQLGKKIAPGLLEIYPAVIWEDSDECLEIQPEDVRMGT